MNFTLAQLAGQFVDIPQHLANLNVSAVTSDSRAVTPGALFVALPGTKVDGRAFIEDALKKGARAVIAPQENGATAENIIRVENPRRVYAQIASVLHSPQPDTIAAVTGTNGKTSVSVFVRQIWEQFGFRAASLGTIGVSGPDGVWPLTHTTPDPMELHTIAARLRKEHVNHLAIEASSHGLSQYRLDGLKLSAGAFTNLTHDHLDYHATIEEYFLAKMRLFDELLPPDAAAVIDADSPYATRVVDHAQRRGLIISTVGRAGTTIKLVSSRSEGFEQHLVLETASGKHEITLPLAGDFQVSNALVAAGLVIAMGGDETIAIRALQSLKGASGRLEFVGRTALGASTFIDYAHTPDALSNALSSLRPYAKAKLVVVFGCGGDRDKKKRPVMGEIAARLADVVIVTDDNPRSENAAEIRQHILSAAKDARDVGDRAAAIHAAVHMLEAGDLLLVAGKGHETGQTVAGVTRPFSDHEAVRAALAGQVYHV
jgi:UDP-N-acetylmuramoyl-L-alanyl-D-glutamate--2,6-diaminopimelate ligase